MALSLRGLVNDRMWKTKENNDYRFTLRFLVWVGG